jgi:hypothetical protein
MKAKTKTRLMVIFKLFIGVGVPVLIAFLMVFLREMSAWTGLGIYTLVLLILLYLEINYCVLVSPEILVSLRSKTRTTNNKTF